MSTESKVSSIRELPITHGEAQALAREAAVRQAPLDNLVELVTPMLEHSRRRRRSIGEWMRVNHRRMREILAATTGCVAPVVAAYEWHPWAGLIATGVAALIWDKLAFAAEDTPGAHRDGAK